MQLLDCIKVYDNVLPIEPIGSFVKWLGTQKFQPAPTIGGLNREIRKADHYKLDIKSPLQSNVHWHNFLYKALRKHLQKYAENFIEFRCDRFIDIVALKINNTLSLFCQLEDFLKRSLWVSGLIKVPIPKRSTRLYTSYIV